MRKDMVYVTKRRRRRRKGNHLEQWRDAMATDCGTGGVGWDPTLQGLGCCDKDLDLNPMQWMLWKALQRGIRFLFWKHTGDNDGSRDQCG